MHTQRSFLAATAVAAVFAPVSAHAAKFVGSKASASRPTALRALDGASQGRELGAVGDYINYEDFPSTVLTYDGHDNTACQTAADSVYNMNDGSRDGLKDEFCATEKQAFIDANSAYITAIQTWSDEKKATASCDGDAEVCDYNDARLGAANCEYAEVYGAMMDAPNCDLAQLLDDYDAYVATLTPEPTTAPEPTMAPESEAPTPEPSCTFEKLADCAKVAAYAYNALEDVYDAQARKGTISKSAGLSSVEAIGEEEAGVSAGISLIPSACLVASAALTCYFA